MPSSINGVGVKLHLQGRQQVFTLQNSGAPVSSKAVEQLVVEGLYGGKEGIKAHMGKDASTEDVFRSQVNPGDPIGALGGNFGGVNNHANIFSQAFGRQILSLLFMKTLSAVTI